MCDLPDPYESAVESERAEIAADLLAGFSAKDRTFATLYFGEELDPNEIATRMNISVKTVYSKKHKIQSPSRRRSSRKRRRPAVDAAATKRPPESHGRV